MITAGLLALLTYFFSENVMTPELIQILIAAGTALGGYLFRHFDLLRLHAAPAVPGRFSRGNLNAIFDFEFS